MISTFKIRNFRSILDMTVDFRFAEGKAPNGYKNWDTLPFLEADNGTRLVPCMALFGANASGKTNVFRAMDNFRRAVLSKEAVEFYQPNKLNDSFESTVYELTFILGDSEFVYTLDFNDDEIRREALAKNGVCLYSIKHNTGIFSALSTGNYDEKRLQEILDVECSDGKGHQISTFLMRIGENYRGLNDDLMNVFGYILLGVLVFNDNDIFLPDSLEGLKTHYNDNEKRALAAVVDLVRKLDVDVKDIVIRREEVDKGRGRPNKVYRDRPNSDHYEVYDIKSFHSNIHGERVAFDFAKEESNGTKRISGLIGALLFALKGGHVLFVDELDCSLHSLLLRELIRLFKDKRYNSKGAQLLFTTHNTDILDDEILRVSEVAIIRKTLQAGSLIKRIVEFKGDGRDVRNVTKFRKQYLKGFYSGIPHPAI